MRRGRYALRFGDAATTVVNCGTLGGLNPTAISVMGWYYFNSLTVNRGLWSKTQGASPFSNLFCRCGATADPSALGVRWTGTTAMAYTMTTARVTTGKWWFVGVTVNTAGGAGDKLHLYLGDLWSPCVDEAMTVGNEGAGLHDLSTFSFKIGNRDNGGDAFVGNIANTVIVSRVLTKVDMISWQQALVAGIGPSTPGIYAALGAWSLGSQGTMPVVDLSGRGNTGVVTGAFPVPANLPITLTPRRRYWALGFNPAWARQANHLISGGGAA